MTVQFIIEGDLITRREVISQEYGRVSDMLPLLTAYTPLEMSMLPRNTRYVKTSTPAPNRLNVQLLVCEPPRVQQIHYRMGRGAQQDFYYRLGMPWTIFWLQMSSTRMAGATGDQNIWSPQHWGVFWSRDEYRGLETPALGALLPNCYSDGRVCFGTTQVPRQPTLGAWVDIAIGMFWQSEFNTDVAPQMPYPDLEAWQNDPNPISFMDATGPWAEHWANHTRPLGDLLRNVSGVDWSLPIPDTVDGTPIPDLQTVPTFFNVTSWVNALSDDQYARLMLGMEARRAANATPQNE